MIEKYEENQVEKIDWMAEKSGISKEDLARAEGDREFCETLLANHEADAVKTCYSTAAVLAIFERNGWELPQHSVYSNRTLRSRFLRIARGEVLPELYLKAPPDIIKSIEHLPLDTQRRVIDNEPIAVYVGKNGGGEDDTLQVEPMNMLPAVRRQVFDTGRIRDVAAQRAYLLNEERKTASAPKPINQDYEIKGGKVHILRPSILTKDELIHLAGKLAK